MPNKHLNMNDMITRFFDDSINVSEEKELYSWLKEKDENRKEFLEMYNIWTASALINKDFNAEMAMNVLIKNIQQEERSKRKSQLFKRVVQITTGIAATIAIFLSLNYFVGMKESNVSTVSYTHVVKAQQLKERIVLTDGSVVWINKGTILSYPDEFNVTNREVKIEGKAFFIVAKDINKPFIVNLGEDKIEVYGTSFNVRNYLDEDNVEIVLSTGSVELELCGIDKGILLKPNEKVVYSKATKESTIEEVDASKCNIWTEDKLTFDNNTLSNVIPYLENW